MKSYAICLFLMFTLAIVSLTGCTGSGSGNKGHRVNAAGQQRPRSSNCHSGGHSSPYQRLTEDQKISIGAQYRGRQSIQDQQDAINNRVRIR